MDFLITTHELHRIEAATPQTTAPQKVRFSFPIGYDVFLSVTAEVTEEREDGGTVGYDVTILECVEENGGGELHPYHKGCEGLRKALEEAAIEAYHNPSKHI
jgi:hypothetical protein